MLANSRAYRDCFYDAQEQDGWKQLTRQEGRIALAGSGLGSGTFGEKRYFRRAVVDSGGFGAMPWTTLGLAVAMGCTDAERHAIAAGLQPPCTRPASERQQREQHHLATQLGNRRTAWHAPDPPYETAAFTVPVLNAEKMDSGQLSKRLMHLEKKLGKEKRKYDRHVIYHSTHIVYCIIPPNGDVVSLVV